MITPQQAREEYGFTDGSSKEDQLALGLYHAAEGLFKNRFFRILDYAMPFLILVMILVVLAGISMGKASPVFILVMGGMALVFIPQYRSMWQKRRDNSGMCHFSQEMGEHFLVAYGTCAKKEVVSGRRLLPGGKLYRLRVRFSKNRYLDDVRVMKELYEDTGEGARVCVMMADSPHARQLIGAPVHFTEKAFERKHAQQQFENPNPRRLRELSREEREYYIGKYQEYIQYWNGNYGKKYRAAAAVFLAGIVVFLFLAMQSIMALFCMMTVCCVYALRAQKKEFKGHLSFMQEASVLEAVDVTIRREQGYTPDQGTKKQPNSAVHFVDGGGLVLWTLRSSEDLERFRQGDQAVLIVHGKEMLPFLRCPEPSKRSKS